MRDPLTKLAIVDPSEVDREICKAFPEYFAVSGKLAILHYVGRAFRRTKYGTERRVLLVSNSCLYLCREDGAKRRCVKIDAVAEAIMFQDMYILLKIPSEYDLLFKLVNTAESDYLLNVLRIIRNFNGDKGSLVVRVVSGEWKRFNPNFQKPDNYVNEVREVPFLHEPDSKSAALDAFLSPPPPPVPKGNSKLAVASPSDNAMAILKHPLLDGTLSVPAPEPITAPFQSNHNAHSESESTHDNGRGDTDTRRSDSVNRIEYQSQLERLQDAQAELARQQSEHLELMKRLKAERTREDSAPSSGGTGSGTLRTPPSFPPSSYSAAERSMPPQPQRQPPPNSMPLQPPTAAPFVASASLPPQEHSLSSLSQLWKSPVEVRTRVNTASTDRPGPLEPSVASGTVPPEHTEAMQKRIIQLEEELMLMKERLELQEAAAGKSPAAYSPVARHPLLDSRNPSIAVSASPPAVGRPQPTIQDPASYKTDLGSMAVIAAPQAVTTDTAITAHSVEEFERSISGRALSDRVVLRQYVIDDKRARIGQALSTGSPADAYRPLEVAQLQDDLLQLVANMEEDLLKATNEAPRVVDDYNKRTQAALQQRSNLIHQRGSELNVAHQRYLDSTAGTARSPAARQGREPELGQPRAAPDSTPMGSQDTFLNWMAAVTKALVENEHRQRHSKGRSSRAVTEKEQQRAGEGTSSPRRRQRANTPAASTPQSRNGWM
jgi:hypothetical protein